MLHRHDDISEVAQTASDGHFVGVFGGGAVRVRRADAPPVGVVFVRESAERAEGRLRQHRFHTTGNAAIYMLEVGEWELARKRNGIVFRGVTNVHIVATVAGKQIVS